MPGLDPAEYRVSAEVRRESGDHEDRGSEAIALPESGLTEPIRIVLRPLMLSGVVLGVEGAPACDAAVVLGRPAREGAVVPLRPEDAGNVEVAHTDAEGRFELGPVSRGATGDCWLFARGNDGTTHAQRESIPRNKPKSMEIRLTPSAISGTLVDAEGSPMSGVLIHPRKLNSEPGHRQPNLLAKTDDKGRFRLHGCDPGTYRLTARKVAELIAEAEVEVLGDAETTAELKHVTAAVQGVVVRPDVSPFEGATVSVGVPKATTDSKGRFRLEGVVPDRRSIGFQDPTHRHDRAEEILVGSNGTAEPLRLVLPDYHPTIALTISRPDGTPADGVEARVAWHTVGGRRSGSSRRQRALGPDARVLCHADDAGKLHYVVLATGVGCSVPTTAEVTGLEREKPVPVRLRPAASISGVVRAEGTGDPLGGVTITPHQKPTDDVPRPLWNLLFDPGPTSDDSLFPATASRDGDGSFTVEPLAAGTYELRVWDTFGHTHTETVELAEGEHREDAEFLAPAPVGAAFVTGRVVDTDHEPVADTEVHLRLWHTWSGSRRPTTPEFFEGSGRLRRVVTDAQRRFRLGPLPRQPWIIVAGDRGHVDQYGIVASLDRGRVEDVVLVKPPERE